MLQRYPSKIQLPLVVSFCLVMQVLGCRSDEDSDPRVESGQQQTETAGDIAEFQSDEQKLRDAQSLLQQGKTDEALQLVQQILLVSPTDSRALQLIVGIKQLQGNFREAGDLAVRVAETDASIAGPMLMVAFHCHLRCQEFTMAEADLVRAVKVSPNVVQVHRLSAQFLNAQGRRMAASKHVRELIRMKDVQQLEVLSLIDLRGPFLLMSFDNYTKDAPLSLFSLGELRYEYSTSKSDPADQLVLAKRITDKFPDSAAGAAFRCRMLADYDRMNELRNFLIDVPEGVTEQGEYWFAVGMLLSRDEKDQEAIGAFCEAIRCDPTDRESLREMIAICSRIGEFEHALFLRQRLADLDQIFRIAKDADADKAKWIAGKLQEQVRPWEAAAWLMQAVKQGGTFQQSVPELNRRHQRILEWEKGASPEQLQKARIQTMLGFSAEQWPVPELTALSKGRDSLSVVRKQANLAFDDVAANVGIETTFVSGFPLDGRPYAIHEVNGGGLAAFDYDLDGQCDIYVVQSGGDPRVVDDCTANQLFRLLPDKRFVEVTDETLTGDRQFGQGVCVGDINQDGFPDLLVANIGSNSIYLNQGDGTFRQANGLLADNPFQWTSSIGLGDINGDHLPDLVEVNYIDGKDVFDLRCTDNYLDCQPQAFRKSHDRILIADSKGHFVPSESFSRSSPTAKLGFGVVMANFDRKHGNDFFISNDGDFNHYWLSQPSPNSGISSFDLVEAGNLHGCSIGRGGNSQACMGIASADFNRDGTLDLHVTNFENESANLFLQSKTGSFSDQAARKGLVQPSFGVLGFGTQAADFDNDGWQDIAVLNGHVYDGRVNDIPFRMLPQLLRGHSDGFLLQPGAAGGDYWGRKKLGRTLATLDWNQDGRIDLIASHLDQPIALLQNNSTVQNWLQIELSGVLSEREAIGAEVQVSVADERWTGWQIGGDGLMCSNESLVHFGLGDVSQPARVEVQWPSGKRTVLDNLPLNQRYLIVEGQTSAFQR